MVEIDVLTKEEDFVEIIKNLENISLKDNDSERFILLDGTLLTTHNLFINLAIGIAANEVFGYRLAFLNEKKSEFLKMLCKAVGAQIIDKNEVWHKTSMMQKIQFKWLRIFKSKFGSRGLLRRQVGGILIGDLIYDSIVRFEPKRYTQRMFKNEDVVKYTRRAIKEYFILQNIYRKFSISMTSFSHKFYVSFGLNSRFALKKSVPYISKSRAHLNLVKNHDELMRNNYFIDDSIKKRIDQLQLEVAESYINKRFSGEIEQNDVIYAFASKHEIPPEELIKAFNFTKKQPICVIAGHAFSDAPHSDSSMIYPDYYVWFFRTLELIKSIDHINWVIKPHPAAEIFSEDGVVESLVEESANICLCPQNVKTNSLLKVSDAVVTVRGTIGLECQLFDAQTILAGHAYYMNLGFSQNCKSEHEYIKALRSIQFKTHVSDEVKSLVKKVIYWKSASYLFSSGIFGPEMIPNTKDDKLLAHERKNLESLRSHLSSNEYKEDIYYKSLIDFFQKEKKTLCALDYKHQIS